MHPKALYTECMKNSANMHHYASQPDLLVEDMSAILCKDMGCMVNYCGLLKKSYPSEWENSSDCVDEYKNFTDCMKMEQRRFNWMPASQRREISKYDYIQQRLGEKRL